MMTMIVMVILTYDACICLKTMTCLFTMINYLKKIQWLNTLCSLLTQLKVF